MYKYALLDTPGDEANFELPLLMNVRTEFEHKLGTFQVAKIKWSKTRQEFIVYCKKIKDEIWITEHAKKGLVSFTMEIGAPLV